MGETPAGLCSGFLGKILVTKNWKSQHDNVLSVWCLFSDLLMDGFGKQYKMTVLCKPGTKPPQQT